MDLKRLSGSIGKTWRIQSSTGWSRTCAFPTSRRISIAMGSATEHMEAAVQPWRNGAAAQPLTGMRVEVRRLPAGPRCCCSTCPGAPGVRCCSTGIWTAAGIHRLAAGSGALGAGDPRGASSTVAAPPTTGYAVFRLAHGDRRAEGAAGALPAPGTDRGLRRSGSGDLPAHLESLGATLGDPRSWCAWTRSAATTIRCGARTSLRVNLLGTLRVRVLTEGVHSGMATASRRPRFAISSSSWPVSRARSTGDPAAR